MIENGIMEKMRKNYRPRIDKCLVKYNLNRPRMTRLKLIDLSSGFVFWTVGVTLALSTFFAELAVTYLKRKLNQIPLWWLKPENCRHQKQSPWHQSPTNDTLTNLLQQNTIHWTTAQYTTIALNKLETFQLNSFNFHNWRKPESNCNKT